jgi:hypothetical protein
VYSSRGMLLNSSCGNKYHPSFSRRIEIGDPYRVSEGKCRHLQYTERGRGQCHTSCGAWLPTIDQVIMDAAKSAAKMTGQVYDLSATNHVDKPQTNALTNQGEVMMFHIDKGKTQDEDQNRWLWQRRPACKIHGAVNLQRRIEHGHSRPCRVMQLMQPTGWKQWSTSSGAPRTTQHGGAGGDGRAHGDGRILRDLTGNR